MAKYSLPISLSTLLHTARGATDVAFLGRLGTEEQAGGNLALALYTAVCVFYMSITYGMSPLTSQAFGAENFRLVGVWLQIAIVAQLAVSLVIIPSTILLTRPLLSVCSLSGNALENGVQYSFIITWAFFPDGIFETLREYLRSQNIINFPSAISLFATGINAVLNYVFIFGLPGYWRGLASGDSP